MPIDEIESKLHPRLVEYILEKFLKESESAQLLISTHYDNLFDEEDLLRKDCFWFTEKGEDGATKLYPLSGFKGLGRISSLQKAYKFGKFGAVPNIDLVLYVELRESMYVIGEGIIEKYYFQHLKKLQNYKCIVCPRFFSGKNSI